ncbi:MAG: glycosyltransferase, partial [Lachnospiraceae bacterium]|nr:glycosyltransferase [Lachnospiraceae bacterium]
MAKKKVLMIIPTLSNGGAERVVSNLSIGLEKEYDIDILLDYDNVGYDYRGNIIKCLPNVKKEPKGLLKIFMNLKKYVMLRRMKKNHQYDVYISHLRLSNFWNALSGSFNCSTIATVHYSISRKLSITSKRPAWFYVERYSYKNVNKLVAVSHGIGDELHKIYGISDKNILTIWNGTDIAHIHKLSQENISENKNKWFNDNEQNIVTVGRYTTQKGQWHLIRAFSKVVHVYPNAKLIILGEGE